MNITNARLGALSIGALWMVTAGLPVRADDTELFVATSSGAGIRPNILFVIDDSGSMTTAVVTQEPYNPLTTYPGRTGVPKCSLDRVYFQTGTGTDPRCDQADWFNLDQLSCQSAIVAFKDSGKYIDH